MPTVAEMIGREILDSRGNPTLEVEVHLADGAVGRASVPAGKSTGTREAHEWRDHVPDRYGGRGVQGAVRHLASEILPALRGVALQDQGAMDGLLIDLDGTPEKSRLGANTILGCSLAFARAYARSEGVPLVRYLSQVAGCERPLLPMPMMNVINGGRHADSGLSTQEFMVVPHGAPTLAEAVRFGTETYHALGRLLEEEGYRVSVGDEGGYAAALQTTEHALELLVRAIERAGYHPGTEISLALDFAANDFWHDRLYRFEGRTWKSDDMTAYCLDLVRRFPIISIEDGLAEDDWVGWVTHTRHLKAVDVQCVGDDIFVTNPDIFRRGITEGVASAILIKPNQIGTLSETLTTMKIAAEAGYGTVISHRSGETEDAFIADFAVATAAGQIKAGAPARGERVAKYNQLLRLAETLPETSLATTLGRRKG